MKKELAIIFAFAVLSSFADGTVSLGQDAGKDATGCDSSVFIGRAAGAKANNVDGSVGIGFGALLGAKNKQGVTYLNGHLYASQPDDEFYIRGDRSIAPTNAPIYYKNGTLNLNANAVNITNVAITASSPILPFLNKPYSAYVFTAGSLTYALIYPTSSGATNFVQAVAACECIVLVSGTRYDYEDSPSEFKIEKITGIPYIGSFAQGNGVWTAQWNYNSQAYTMTVYEDSFDIGMVERVFNSYWWTYSIEVIARDPTFESGADIIRLTCKE